MQTLSKIAQSFLLTTVILATLDPCYAKKSDQWVDSPLAESQQIALEKAGRLVKSGRAAQAGPMIAQTLAEANDIPKCLAIATFTENYGFPLLNVRKQCLNKALSLCSSGEDYLQVALKSRQYECYEVTREAITKLLANANNRDECLDLARKAQEVAAGDVTHMALEKALAMTNTIPGALAFVREAKLLGADDLVRKTVKDLIDDEDNTHQLLILLKQIEPFELKDLNRYILKKACDQGSTFEDYVEIYNAGRRHHEQDVMDLAQFRAKRKNIYTQMDKDHKAFDDQMNAYKSGQPVPVGSGSSGSSGSSSSSAAQSASGF